MSANSKNAGPLVIGGEPRIDFLPVEIKERKKSRRARRSLIALVVVVAMVCATGYVGSAFIAAQAQIALDAERGRTQALLKEQGEYSSASTIAQELQATKDAVTVGLATEILWMKYMRTIISKLPRDMTIVQFTVDSQNAIEGSLVTSIPLDKTNSTTSIALVTTAKSLVSAAGLMQNLKSLPGFADATMTSADRDPETRLYKINVMLHLDARAFERRFLTPLEVDPNAEETEEEAEETPTDTSTGVPTGTPTPLPTEGATEDEG